MPRIGLVLPGEPRQSVVAVAEEYLITVTRNDGIACTDTEAWAAVSMWCTSTAMSKGKQGRKKKPSGEPAN